MDETQTDAPFVAFYDMHAVTFVPPDEMADVTIAGLQCKNINLVQIESTCRRHFHCSSNYKTCIQQGRKHSGYQQFLLS